MNLTRRTEFTHPGMPAAPRSCLPGQTRDLSRSVWNDVLPRRRRSKAGQQYAEPVGLNKVDNRVGHRVENLLFVQRIGRVLRSCPCSFRESSVPPSPSQDRTAGIARADVVHLLIG